MNAGQRQWFEKTFAADKASPRAQLETRQAHAVAADAAACAPMHRPCIKQRHFAGTLRLIPTYTPGMKLTIGIRPTPALENTISPMP